MNKRNNNVKWYGHTYMKQLTTKNNKTTNNVKTTRTTRKTRLKHRIRRIIYSIIP